ncbi:uncharacterized protein LOC132062017 [Lycium ferocissimum]|uniref:uncharacterized protein LOC132062017 n=1 Tax=Lycium ferocissimum TaxID=112874 RepID=UPI002815CFC0|nr:uncharacterized protein LOC132062017 [Lycium ferocissimum]
MFKTYSNPLVFTNILPTDEEKRTINFSALPQEAVVDDVVVEPQVSTESGPSPSVHGSGFQALKKEVANVGAQFNDMKTYMDKSIMNLLKDIKIMLDKQTETEEAKDGGDRISGQKGVDAEKTSDFAVGGQDGGDRVSGPIGVDASTLKNGINASILDLLLDEFVAGIDLWGISTNKTPTLDDLELPPFNESQIVELETKTSVQLDHMDITPELEARNRKPGPYGKSPFTGFSSTGSSTNIAPTYFHIKHPFANCIGFAIDIELIAEFEAWGNKILNPYNLGVDKIDKMDWFYNMMTTGISWGDLHVDVIMYYLRKKAKYGPNNGVRYVTTDCFFKSWVELIHQQFKQKNYDPSIITPEHDVAQVIRGYKILANISWDKVDYVIIPINVGTKFHWVLSLLSIKKRCLYVYDSLPGGKVHTNAVTNILEKLAMMIPLFFNSIGFYGKRDDIDWNNEPAYIHQSIDCGVYVCAFAEYISDGMFNIPKATFNHNLHRSRYAALLWDYARQKQDAGAISESEVTGFVTAKLGGPKVCKEPVPEREKLPRPKRKVKN